MYQIVLDAMGGDNAPKSVVEGAVAAAKEFSDCRMVLVGREEEVRAALAAAGGQEGEQIAIVNAAEVIEMSDDPANAFRKKKDSSMTVGLNLLKAGEGDAFVSAGSTGALLSAATLLVKRVKGIKRSAVAPIIPVGSSHGYGVLVDAGANAECTPEYLLQFGYMGACYAEKVMGIENPRVGLLNIGAEEEKGDPLHKEAWQLLNQAKEAGRLNFVGNVESREAVSGEADVIVSDGFSGNIFLKCMEGTAMYLSGMLKNMFKKNTKSKLGYLMVKDGVADFKARMDYREVGGSVFLGISKPVIKAHGSSDGRAIRSAIKQARDAAASGVTRLIEENVPYMQGKEDKQG